MPIASPASFLAPPRAFRPALITRDKMVRIQGIRCCGTLRWVHEIKVVGRTVIDGFMAARRTVHGPAERRCSREASVEL